MDERRLDTLVLIERRGYARQALWRACSSRPRRADEQRTVPAGRRDGESAHGELLTDHITIIELLVILRRHKRIRWRKRSRAQLGKVIDAHVIEPREPGHARRIGSR